ncbi:MAG: hypothetical protein JO170_28480, partial [Verrucomicrobia bacterium]|nr:hypothetical protein [Verrucomicrobiota bacterium]
MSSGNISWPFESLAPPESGIRLLQSSSFHNSSYWSVGDVDGVGLAVGSGLELDSGLALGSGLELGSGLAVGSGVALGELTGDGAGVAIAEGAGVACWLAAAGAGVVAGVGLAAGGLTGPAACGWFAARSLRTNSIAWLIGMPT